MGIPKPSLRILLVEDSPDDIDLIRRALVRSGLDQSLNVVEDGTEAISYLQGEKQYADRQKFPFPTLILTDLKMPRMSGFELLQWIRQHPQYRVVPTIVFSSSAVEEDVREAYEMGANAYMMKPNEMKGLVELLRLTYDYWSHCERPPEFLQGKGD